MTQHVLVTGGAGFLGTHLVCALLDQPELADSRIVILDDLSSGAQENVMDSTRVEFVQGSITDVQLVDDLYGRMPFKYVYHLAAHAAEGLSHYVRRFSYTNNLLGSVNLVNASVAHGCECFVFTSSIAVYGAGQAPMREDMVPQPEDPYGIGKYAVELDLAAANRMFGLKHVIFRPHNVYGEYQNIGDRYRNVVGIFMNQILHGKPMTIFGDGEQQRAFSYVADVVPMIARAPFVAGASNGVFNIGADQPCTVNELAVKTAKAMDVEPVVQHLAARKEVVCAYSDHSRCRDVFGRSSQTPLDKGLRSMARWAKAWGPRDNSKCDAVEISLGMPPIWQE